MDGVVLVVVPHQVVVFDTNFALSELCCRCLFPTSPSLAFSIPLLSYLSSLSLVSFQSHLRACRIQLTLGKSNCSYVPLISFGNQQQNSFRHVAIHTLSLSLSLLVGDL